MLYKSKTLFTRYCQFFHFLSFAFWTRSEFRHASLLPRFFLCRFIGGGTSLCLSLALRLPRAIWLTLVPSLFRDLGLILVPRLFLDCFRLLLGPSTFARWFGLCCFRFHLVPFHLLNITRLFVAFRRPLGVVFAGLRGFFSRWYIDNFRRFWFVLGRLLFFSVSCFLRLFCPSLLARVVVVKFLSGFLADGTFTDVIRLIFGRT